MTMEGAAVAMETIFPDAPSDVLSDDSAQEEKAMVRSIYKWPCSFSC